MTHPLTGDTSVRRVCPAHQAEECVGGKCQWSHEGQQPVHQRSTSISSMRPLTGPHRLLVEVSALVDDGGGLV